MGSADTEGKQGKGLGAEQRDSGTFFLFPCLFCGGVSGADDLWLLQNPPVRTSRRRASRMMRSRPPPYVSPSVHFFPRFAFLTGSLASV